MSPLLCILYILSGTPGVGTADLYPLELTGKDGCKRMGDMTNQLFHGRKVAFSVVQPNKSVPGEKPIRIQVKVNSELVATPLDPTEEYADNVQ